MVSKNSQKTNRSISMLPKRLIPPPLQNHRNRSSILSNLQLPMFSTVASAAATAMFLRSLATNFLPPELNLFLRTKLRLLLSRFSNEITLFIDEYHGFSKNNLFSAAALHVAAVAAPSAMTFRAALPPRQKKIDVNFCGGEEISDYFGGIHLRWRLVTTEVKNTNNHQSSEKKEFRLSFDKEHRTKVVEEYLPYVLERSETLKREKKTLKLFSLNAYYGWRSVNFDHPSKFETLAMDDEVKKMIMDDLDRFLKRKEYYKRVGKAWKRGYLLFGPPGTGKSSLIAAMANYLKFDVYDLELSSVTSDSMLRHLLMTTANRSILVVEDIDASVNLALTERNDKDNEDDAKDPKAQKKNSKVTLSGVLNFIDGLWSSMGDERIIIFTTNHKEKLDDALLRPGRMDLHVHMSYCTPCGFRLLANNYLGITDHPLVFKAEELIGSAKVTPAEIGEQLLKSDDPGVALEELIKFLEGKRSDNESLKLKEVSKGCDDDDNDGVTKLMNMAKALPLETRREILGTAEAADAFKILTQLLEQKVEKVSATNSDSSSLLESAGQNGVKVN